ncbi:MAG: alpha/beta hydrolase [Alphaproteobacteria bacterium]
MNGTRRRVVCERHVTVQDGLQVYLRDYDFRDAPGTPVLCLPGLTRSSRDYHRLAIRLAPGRRVICPDLRGRGRSGRDPDWRHYVPTTYIDDLRHVLAALGLDRIIVIGTSMGGLLAMGLGLLMPGGLAGVVINDVGPAVPAGEVTRIAAYVGSDRPVKRWRDAVASVKTLFPDLGYRDDRDWLRAAHGTYRRGADGLLHFDWDPAIARALVEGAGKVPDLWPLFGALRRMPCLAFRGALSKVLTPETFAAMKRANPDLIQVTVPGVGHTPSLVEPEAIAAIETFLAGIA